MKISDHYDWVERNRERRFATWEDEIDHMKSLGYELVRPDFRVVDWVTRLRAPETRPVLFVCSPNGPREMGANLDRCAGELGYPLYFKACDCGGFPHGKHCAAVVAGLAEHTPTTPCGD